MERAVILSAGSVTDGQGDLSTVCEVERKLDANGYAVKTLIIDPLKAGWNTPLQRDHFRSGCAPLEALRCAQKSLAEGTCEAAVIRGTDNLKTDFQADGEKRRQLMEIYGQESPLPHAYTALAHEFIRIHGIAPSDFVRVAEKLYDNYVRTARQDNHYRRPAEKWFESLTDLFRGVDCANPAVDFSGRVVLATETVADAIGLPDRQRVHVLGVGVAQAGGDGPDYAGELAAYRHLMQAYAAACKQAGFDYAGRYLSNEALLEVYSCYPVVPMAFLLATEMARSFQEVESIVEQYPLTVTGGMNIAKAAWNNPALYALIVMYKKICSGEACSGAVHGNGGLGFKQGVAILGRRA